MNRNIDWKTHQSKSFTIVSRVSPGGIGSSVKPLPATIAKLQNPEELDLGGNGLQTNSTRNFKSKKLEEIRIGLTTTFTISHRSSVTLKISENSL